MAPFKSIVGGPLELVPERSLLRLFKRTGSGKDLALAMDSVMAQPSRNSSRNRRHILTDCPPADVRYSAASLAQCIAPLPFLALGALGSPATAAWLKPAADSTLDAPVQTGHLGADAGEDHQMAIGWSPVPTNAPRLAGAMDMRFALGKRAELSQTCGWGSLGNSFTCVSSDASCASDAGYVGCCETGRSCNAIKTKCIDYDASSAGDCDILDDFQTMCCGSSAFPACYTLTGTSKGESFTVLACSVTSGTGSLFFSDPLATTNSDDDESTATDDDESSTTDDASDSTETGTATGTDASDVTVTVDPSPSQTTDDSDDDDGPNVGAIAGGTVGGVAALGLVGLAGFLLFRRRNKKTTPGTTPPSNGTPPVAPAMAQTQNPQNPQSPGPSFVPSSPSNAAYPSGVPSNFQPGYQQPYDPNAAAAYGQQAYSPPPQNYGGYAQPQGFQNQYPQQQGYGQQGQYPAQYGVGGYQPSQSTSPPPGGITPSPGPKEGEAGFVGHQTHTPAPQQHQAQELPAVNPIGNENNRAELG
ncbi:hypothetical protein CEP52_001584 [Fusarium oligoseptatum]|uniref:Uncharacterized protein n=1 Tax=Fusarium oligoseptatum TaxID=2604345 RepID=A0A428UI93_9HYPO|nr:hypothetical protein CEP52_001584 [Fusarium oligoseptatum]